MAYLTVAGFAANRAAITFPISGLWTIDADLDADTLPTGRVAIAADSFALSGTIQPGRSGDFAGKTTARIVAGNGSLAATVADRWYRNVPARIVVSDLVQATGETLSPTSSLPSMTTSFARLALPGASLLELLTAQLGLSWRAIDDGSLWLGTETWPDSGITDSMDLWGDEALGVRRVATDAMTLRPGTTLNGRKITLVRYEVEQDSVTCEAWT